MERNRRITSCRRASGFTLIELLVVVGIIGVMAAVGLPMIANAMHSYRIRGAAQQVAGEIQNARTRAIMRNVATGVSFAVVGTNRYRTISDDPIPGGAPADQLGPIRELPWGVEFIPNPTAGVRFTRLGALDDFVFAAPCVPADGARCDDAPGTGFAVAPAGAVLGLIETRTGIRRQITIARGGRVMQDR